jgi:hypothetical protein
MRLSTLFSWIRIHAAVLGLVLFGLAVLVFSWARPTPSEAETLAERFGVERSWAFDSYCTSWRPEGRRKAVVSAAHCHASVSATHEDGTLAPDYIDGAVYNGRLEVRPRKMVDGEAVILIGYPARSEVPVLSRGVVHLAGHRRGGDGVAPVSIVKLTQPAEPVVAGMSGGAVLSEAGEPLGILTTSNGVADLDGDGQPDYSADVVELHELWVIQPQPQPQTQSQP